MTSAPARLISDMRGVRYGEILTIFAREEGLQAEVWGSQMLHDCPQSWWDSLDAAGIAQSEGAIFTKLNGPRAWVLDGLGTKVAVVEPVVKQFSGMPMRRIATVELGTTPAAPPYTERHVNRGAVFFWDAGKPVYELVSPEGTSYVMQALCKGVDNSIDEAALTTLGERLQLPDGWSYRTRILDEELVVDTTAHVATVLQDEFENSYTLPG